MKHRKVYMICLFTLLCLGVNYAGKTLALALELPVWLDAFGTMLCACVSGPVCGAFVGAASGIIYAAEHDTSFIYGLVGIGLALVVGHAVKRPSSRTFFGFMRVSLYATLISVILSVPLNLMFHNGLTGNMWGDGVIGMFREAGIPEVISEFAGEFYIDIVDKSLCLLAIRILLEIWGTLKRMRRARAEKNGAFAGGGSRSASHLALFLLVSLCAAGGLFITGERTDAAEERPDYNDYVQTVFSSSNGLPSGEANDIAQTNDGILWIGTYAGLYRYNGREFRWMDGFDSVRNVNCLYVDEAGRLWIGTNDNGLSIFVNDRIVNVLDQDGGLPSDSVRCITESSDGYYYVGTSSSMQILTLNGGIKKRGTLWEISYADSAAADSDGHVACVTQDGRLFLLEKGLIRCSMQLPASEGIFNACGFDAEGRLMAGTSENKIHRYDISSGYFLETDVITCEGINNLNHFTLVSNGDIFVTADDGIGCLPADGEFERIYSSNFNNSIDNMLVDYQGNLWFTSSRLGLLRMSRSAFKDIFSTVGLENHVVNAVTRWQGNYYFGTDKGMDVVDGSCRSRITNELTEQLDGVRIRCMYTDPDEHLWICTYGKGLWEVMPDGRILTYDKENGCFNRARVVMQLEDGRIAAGGDLGLCFIRDQKVEKRIGYSPDGINSMILTMTEMPDGRILAGTDGDGIAVIEDGEVKYMLTRQDGLSSDVILRTVLDEKSGGVFVVTSNGLCYMDENESIRLLEKFPYFNNYDVWFKDEDTLFVMSSAGIYVVDREDLLSRDSDFSYDLLDAHKGLGAALTANSWNYYDGDHELFLPCDTGVFALDTDHYNLSSRSYLMHLSSYSLDGVSHKIERLRPIQVSRGTTKIELVPEIINYTIQDPYAGYYLEGYDNEWKIVPQSSLGNIVYTNLPMGSYTLHLAVFDLDKETILEERTYQVEKAREIYDNQWFKIYVLIVTMVAVAWVTWFIVVTQLQKTLELQRRQLELTRQQIQMGNETIFAIAKAVDAKDERTSQHSQRVSQYSVLIARKLGLSKKECDTIRQAAQMHDIGKIGIPDRILNKPGRLTDDEYAMMKSHVVRGGEILKDFTLIENVLQGVLYHHERYDGKGYPEGLKGEEIPLYGRIIAVADAFDAMTSNRVYRRQMDFDYVLEEMRKGRGTQFDPKMTDILLGLIDDGTINLEELYKVDDPKQEETT